MHKKLVILIIISFCISGCTINKLDTNNYDSLIDNILLQKLNVRNTVFEGYSYYIPHGLKYIDKNEYNSLLSDRYNNEYYIYVDVVSYYHKVKNKYKVDDHAYYSKKINNKNGGYFEINEINDKYFVEAMYNYVKIEVYTSKDSLSDVVANVCEILSSVKYNDNVLRTIIGDKVLNYKEESFNIFTTKKSVTNYLDYIEKYDSATNDSKKNDFEDEDIINTDINEE